MDDPIELLTHPYIAHAVIAAWICGLPASDVSFLRPEHFSDRRDCIAWKAALGLEAEGVIGGYAALVDRLKRMDALKEIDWETYCSRILSASSIAATFGMEACARAVYEKWRRWRLYELAIRQAGRALDLSIPLADSSDGKGSSR